MLRTAARLTGLIVFLCIYAPVSGRGFVADDFEWITRNRSRSLADLASILTRDNGFYRPVVAFSFAANEYLAGTNPKPYGLTNVALAGLCGLGIVALCAAIRLPRAAGAAAAAVWLLNFHGINMSILWLSGRTALLLTLGATMSVASLLGRRLLLALSFFALALFSKEEALLIPLIGATWLYLFQPERKRAMLPWLLGCASVTTVYLLMRAATNAMLPDTAPVYYRFTFNVGSLLRNVIEYADRAMTFSILVTLLAAAVLAAAPRSLSPYTKRVVVAGVAWLVLSFAITLFLPVRSSLYACLPSVGAATAAAGIIAELWTRSAARRQRYLLYAAIAVPIALLPIYRARTVRYVRNAEFSTQILTTLVDRTKELPEGSTVVLWDDRSGRANLGSAFGSMINEAYFFAAGRKMSLWIEPPVTHADLAGLRRPCPTCADAIYRVRDGRLVSEISVKPTWRD